MPEVPYDSISELQPVMLEKWVKDNVQRVNFTAIHMVSNLPAQ
jgi:hypothetical protein